MNAVAAGPGRREAALAAVIMVAASFGVGLIPNVTRFALDDGTGSSTFIAVRTVFSVAILGGAILWRDGSFRIPLPLALATAIASGSFAVSNYLFVESILYLDVSLVSLIVFSYPVLVAVYYHLAGQSRLSPARLGWVAVAMVGLALALAVSFDAVSHLGLALAAGSSLLVVIMVVAMVAVNERVGGLVTCFHLQLWTLVGFAVAVALTGPQLPGSAVGWSAAFVNGVLNAAVFLAFFVAVRLIGASRATMYGVLEPIAAILLAIWLFDEWLSPLQWLGVALVAAGMFFMEATFGRKAAPADAG